MKHRLIILPDLWGKRKSTWLSEYTKPLSQHFDVVFYDCCELGKIDTSNYTQENLHQQFVSGGIERAVNKLLNLEKDSVNILAFSISGTIAWKFGLSGGQINSLTCVSSTRLRYETEVPNGKIKLHFGTDDEFKPDVTWFSRTNVDHELVPNKAHEMYTEAEYARSLSATLLKETSNVQ